MARPLQFANFYRPGRTGTSPRNDRPTEGVVECVVPPPAFPPGPRRPRPPRLRARSGPSRAGLPEGAYIDPDEPIRRIGAGSPNDPYPPPDPLEPQGELQGALAPHESHPGADEVEVTGIGGGTIPPDLDDGRGVRARGDVERVAAVLESLAGELRWGGASALRLEEHHAPFEAMLRGFLAGYLTARREG